MATETLPIVRPRAIKPIHAVAMRFECVFCQDASVEVEVFTLAPSDPNALPGEAWRARHFYGTGRPPTEPATLFLAQQRFLPDAQQNFYIEERVTLEGLVHRSMFGHCRIGAEATRSAGATVLRVNWPLVLHNWDVLFVDDRVQEAPSPRFASPRLASGSPQRPCTLLPQSAGVSRDGALTLAPGSEDDDANILGVVQRAVQQGWSCIWIQPDAPEAFRWKIRNIAHVYGIPVREERK